MSRVAVLPAATLTTALILTACSATPKDDRFPTAAVPELDVAVITGGLEHPWDVGFLPDGEVLITERPGRFTLLSAAEPDAEVTRVDADLSDVFAQGEGGLMGMVVHPDFAESRKFTTCQTHQRNGQPVDVRLVTWRLAEDGIDTASAEKVTDLVTGLPIADSGRHSGCRPTIGEDGVLYVGTGDTADPLVAQDRTSLGGKVLRVDLDTGQGLPDNPFADSDDANERRLASYGHRNIQGVAVRPDTGDVWLAEHGPRIEDEVNLLELGGNYGWDPGQGGTVDEYDEDVPMTDLDRFPDAIEARWDTPNYTAAICGATFLDGAAWGELDGALAMAALNGSKVIMLTLDGDEVVTRSDPAELDGTYDRLRAARTGPDGALYVTTSNGTDDKLLRVTPVVSD